MRTRGLLAVFSLGLTALGQAGEIEVRRDAVVAQVGEALGVEDVTLASSFARSNGGAYPQLAAGRDGGRRVLIRFNLTPLKGKVRHVQEAALRLSPAPRTSQEAVQIAAYEVSAANGGWTEGRGVFKGDAEEGESTWGFRAYGGARWEGEAGLGRAGVDHEGDPAGELNYQSGPAEISLPSALVEQWINGENHGLLLVATDSEGVQERTLLVHSSEAPEASDRPTLWIRYEE